ncbi:DUF4136 domain-containing protein [Maribacter sp. 2210JD10-5]|uniref:DUF4136 domain-containing protein n=1 Tax=Maribacter sp. 2210JD10-5 TaxID=3386272 RepID=UPI0039BD678A
MKSLTYIFLLLVFASCGAARINYDYDRQTDFSNYTTYNYFDDMVTGLNGLDEKRLFRAMDVTLQTKGLLFSEEPDILINVESKVFQSQPGNTVGVGLGGTGGNVGGGVSVGIPVGGPNTERELVIDLVDAKKDILIWQAVSISNYKESSLPAVKEEKMQELITKIFSKYPPKTRKN